MMRGIPFFLASICLLICSTISPANAIDIDISSSNFISTGSDTFKVLDTFATGNGFNGQYWAEFRWNPVGLVFEPLTAGAMEVVIPSNNIKGTYTLVGFIVMYSDGTVKSTEDNLISFLGTMQIGTTNVHQSFTINGQTGFINNNYVSVPMKPLGGVLELFLSSGRQSISLWTHGYSLTTFSNYGKLSDGRTYEEWDFWAKASDSMSLTKEDVSGNLTDTALGGLVGIALQ